MHAYIHKLGRTALYMAAEGGHVDAAEMLIGKGADVNVQDTWVRRCMYDEYICIFFCMYVCMYVSRVR
jgi:hypothetical protein